MMTPPNYSLERTRTSRSGGPEIDALLGLVRAAQPGRSAMPRCVAGVFNPEGWYRAAGGRSRAQTPGRESVGSVHPEGMLEFCDPSRVGWRFLNHWTGVVAPAFARLLSGKPSACGDGVTPNVRCS